MKANPFFELYVGDRMTSRDFVAMFSPLLVPHTEALFLPGNIVVTGIQGCGKSMLLSLLKSRVRLEFETAETDFPVPSELRKFVCCSVNLAHSTAIDFGYRSYIDDQTLETEFLFGDFLNYLLVDSLFETLEQYSCASNFIRSEIGLNASSSQMNDIVAAVSEIDIWEGWLGQCETIADLRKRFSDRIRAYRRYLHRKDKELDPSIVNTRTAIGAPLIEVARCLKHNGVLDEDTNVFADIDQYEELGNISSRNTRGQRVDYRSVINKALSSRSPEISYRIGTRGHSWRRHGRIHGTSGNLEVDRDYKYIDLDAILRKNEIDSARTKDIFAEFASDVFKRRLHCSGYAVEGGSARDVFDAVYGKEIRPREKVNNFFGLREKEKYVELESEWSEDTKTKLMELAARDLFSAKMGEVWVRQKGDVEQLSGRDGSMPWERNSNRWWRKERAQILVIQIASKSRQKSVWGGAKEVVDLSGGSILAFLSLNQFIWSAWLQRAGVTSDVAGKAPKIESQVQSIGILKASESWVDMVPEQTARSAERRRFVKHVAATLRQKLISDKKLSYPGASGFSVLERDLSDHQHIAEFLEELSDYGNMLMLPHTSKEKGKPSRIKFYFHPIFCPSFGLPYIRTKEPYYAQIAEVARWIHHSGYEVPLGEIDPKEQGDLFGSR